jgi:hypothetical protein
LKSNNDAPRIQESLFICGKKDVGINALLGFIFDMQGFQDFDPAKDIRDLPGKVILITGGLYTSL